MSLILDYCFIICDMHTLELLMFKSCTSYDSLSLSLSLSLALSLSLSLLLSIVSDDDISVGFRPLHALLVGERIV